MRIALEGLVDSRDGGNATWCRTLKQFATSVADSAEITSILHLTRSPKSQITPVSVSLAGKQPLCALTGSLVNLLVLEVVEHVDVVKPNGEAKNGAKGAKEETGEHLNFHVERHVISLHQFVLRHKSPDYPKHEDC